MNQIIKIAALPINNGKLLIVKPLDKPMYISLGGTLENNEEKLNCLKREIVEEISIELRQEPQLYMDPITEPAAGKLDTMVTIYFYLITEELQNIKIDNEIEKYYWLSKEEFENKRLDDGSVLEIASGLSVYAIPKLIEDGLLK